MTPPRRPPLAPWHCQSKIYTACSRFKADWSSTVFAHELTTRSAGFDAENRLYLFALTMQRFDKRQSMRWTPRGAHQLLQTRTRVLSRDRDQVIRRCYPAFRRSQATDIAPVL